MQNLPQIALILAAVGLILGAWGAATYNRLVRVRNHCAESWSGIDTELKRRYELIPNLVSAVQGYAAYERDLFERIIAARNSAISHAGSPSAQAKDENALAGHMRQLFALAEGYPELKASQHFLELQRELANTEDRLQRARRFYNANVRDLNVLIDAVPSNVVAGWFNFTRREYFDIGDAAARQVPLIRM